MPKNRKLFRMLFAGWLFSIASISIALANDDCKDCRPTSHPFIGNEEGRLPIRLDDKSPAFITWGADHADAASLAQEAEVLTSFYSVAENENTPDFRFLKHSETTPEFVHSLNLIIIFGPPLSSPKLPEPLANMGGADADSFNKKSRIEMLQGELSNFSFSHMEGDPMYHCLMGTDDNMLGFERSPKAASIILKNHVIYISNGLSYYQRVGCLHTGIHRSYGLHPPHPEFFAEGSMPRLYSYVLVPAYLSAAGICRAIGTSAVACFRDALKKTKEAM